MVLITTVVGYVVAIVFVLPVHAVPVLVLAWLFSRAGIGRRQLVFVTLSAFGLLSGLFCSLSSSWEGLYVYNLPAVVLGDHVYQMALNHLADPRVASPHFTIPWVLRVPQVYLLVSATVWSLLGLVAQTAYNAIKRPAVTARTVQGWVLATVLVFGTAALVGAVYASQSEEERHGPSQPYATPGIAIGTPELPQWGVISTWEVQDILLSRWVSDEPFSGDLEAGSDVLVTGVVRNTGADRGVAVIELKVDGRALSTRQVALLPDETATVRFDLVIPKVGSYTISLGDSLEKALTIRVSQLEKRQIE